MNKKTLIQIIVIVGCFVGSGVVIYNGLFKKTPPSITDVSTSGVTSQPSDEEAILPYGSKLDFDSVFNKKNKFIYGKLDYPKLNYSLDVEIDEKMLIKPAVKPKE